MFQGLAVPMEDPRDDPVLGFLNGLGVLPLAFEGVAQGRDQGELSPLVRLVSPGSSRSPPRVEVHVRPRPRTTIRTSRASP
jgi:hypothetical protein